ncbi:MAG: CopD family protein [Rhodoplanes sp.]|uniref:CopD family protein n=1 Tax=Rhodoplanes sp. TaxID=1968906 RepID=UPI0017AB7DE5|nr:CopD family protein [Rhodoplanes sp.]NVO13002.1 CopD family protein [Rhodoplanes sp.]
MASVGPDRGENASPGRRVFRAVVGLLVPAAVAAGLILVVPVEAYLWMKAVHLVTVGAWVAGMLALPPLFALHVRLGAGAGTDVLERIEHAVIRHLVNPAMVLTWGFGGWLAWTGGWWTSGWFHGKLALVVVLSAVHGSVSAETRRLARFGGSETARARRGFYMVLNIVGIVSTIGTVFLVIVKPF